MMDLMIPGVRTAGDLARIGSALGRAGVGFEGGGMWAGEAHYLVEDGNLAREVLDHAGWRGVQVRRVLIVPLDADVPGALGRMMERLEDARVRLIAQYSDHDNRKVLVVEDAEAAEAALA